jgi:hypothetical protein
MSPETQVLVKLIAGTAILVALVLVARVEWLPRDSDHRRSHE